MKLLLVRHAAAVPRGTPGIPDEERPFPVLDPLLQAQIREILDIQLADMVKARRILPDGRSMRIRADGGSASRSQERLYEANGAGGVFAQSSR